MKYDISTRQDLELLIHQFYSTALTDKEIGHFFTEVIQLNMEKHIPVITDFWESVILDNMIYRGNVMVKHIELNRLSKMTRAHFDRWVGIWEQTVVNNFEGENADATIQKAKTMRELMLFKIEQSENRGFIL